MINVAVLEDDIGMQVRLVEIIKSWHYTKDVYAFDSNLKFAEISKAVKFDALLADINVVDGNGIDSVRLMKKLNENGVSIIISSNSKPSLVMEAIRAGAVGYLYKDDSKMEIIQAIRDALDDKAPISPGIALTILRMLQDSQKMKSENLEYSEQVTLTAREMEVITLVARGLSNGEIAQVLEVSKNTVPIHIKNIYRKFGTNRRTETIYRARQIGVIK